MHEVTARHAHGYGIMTGADGKVEEHDTLQCCHCAAHFIVRRGSGTKRGFCMKCMAVTCGSPQCMVCLPMEKQIDLAEKGKMIV